VLSNVNGVLYLSNGKHIFVSTSQGAQPTASTRQPRKSTEIVVGSFVKVVQNTDIFAGTTIVGQVYPDERYQVYKIQAPWIALKARDDSILSGWILISELVVADGT
jgi:hypothetical protein